MECEGIKELLAGLEESVVYQCSRAILKGRELIFINKKHDPNWLSRNALYVSAVGGENFREVKMFKPEIESTVNWIMAEAKKLNVRH